MADNKFLGPAGTQELVDRIKELESKIQSAYIIQLDKYPSDYVKGDNVPGTLTFSQLDGIVDRNIASDTHYNLVQIHVETGVSTTRRTASIPVSFEYDNASGGLDSDWGIYMTMFYTKNGIPEMCVWRIVGVDNVPKIYEVTVHRLDEITAAEVEEKFNS